MSVLFDKIKERVERSIAAREFPGCVVGVVSKGGEREIYPFGALTYEPSAPRVELERPTLHILEEFHHIC